MAETISIFYIGEQRCRQTTQQNHNDLIARIQKLYTVEVHDFSRHNTQSTCPFEHRSGTVQVWEFVESCKKINNDVVVKLRTDLWFTKSAKQVFLDELANVLNGTTDVAFIGLDFGHQHNKSYVKADSIKKKVTDFAVIARQSKINSAHQTLELLEQSNDKSGNKTYKLILSPDTRAVSISCQLYLVRKEYKDPSNWEIYKDWTLQYSHKAVEQYQWVLDNQNVINEF